MNGTGTYKGFLCFMDGELYVGEKDGRLHAEASMPAIGVMHTPTKEARRTENGISFIMEVNALDGTVELKEENGRLTGGMFVKEVDMHFSIDMEKVSEEYVFCDPYFQIAAENRSILRTNNTYSSEPGAVRHRYELENREVLKEALYRGITPEHRHDFSAICELMRKTEQVIHQDGVNYRHAEEHGTLAQLRQALEHDGYTNCRGISIVFSGILRAYGFCSSYVECWPADPRSSEIHVVCEVYVPDLEKYAVIDISNRMLFFRDGMPLSLIELRDTIAAGEEDTLTCNEDARNSLDEVLAYLSKNLAVFRKQISNNEKDDIAKKNSICLVPEELRDAFSQNGYANCYITSNRNDFYPAAEKRECNRSEYEPPAVSAEMRPHGR